MSIEPGQTLAHYRIVRRIGAGGMGEVYRATDTVLGRDVAIKTLPQHVAADPERVARFRREAHLLASLNHPHIGAIYGFEQENGVSFLVLELVEGEDLAERLAREALSTREALEIARQVADALEAAHEAGIVHRDLKPANIKVRPDSTVKVLDFGLAKAWSGESVATAAPIENSPTLTHNGTAVGVIMGTAAYMAPEQARGRVVDRRADIWAFGAVLFEMLTRRPAFAGETVTDTLANVVQRDPDWQLMPADTPGSMRTLLRRCLVKRPGERLPHIGAARMELADVLSGGSATHPGQPIEPPAPGDRWRARAGLILVGTVAGAAAALAAFQYWNPQRDAPPLMRVAIELPSDLRLSPGAPPRISPDGRYVAVRGRRSAEEDRIWIRPLDGAAFRPLDGTDGGDGVFWSADSRALAFFAAGTLKRVSVAGGSPQSLYAHGPTEFTVGGSWNSAGVMLFSKGAPSVRHRIFSLSSAGGTPIAVTTAGSSRAERHFYPQWLPDGRRFIFVAMLDRETAGLYVSSIDDPSRRQRIHRDTVPAVVWNDHLLFVRTGTLFAQPVDARLHLAGEPVPLAERAGPFSISDSGTVAYLPARADMQLTWVGRDGRTLTTFGDPRPYRQIALSPQGQVAAELLTGDLESSTWTLDARGVASRLAVSSGDPVWSLDGKEIVYASGSGIVRQRIGSSRATQVVAKQGSPPYPKCWSIADDALLYLVETDKSVDIWRAPGAGTAPEPLVRNGFVNDQPDVSPDGRWLAYISNESGTMDVYVAPYRRPEARVRVSPAGGGNRNGVATARSCSSFLRAIT